MPSQPWTEQVIEFSDVEQMQSSWWPPSGRAPSTIPCLRTSPRVVTTPPVIRRTFGRGVNEDEKLALAETTDALRDGYRYINKGKIWNKVAENLSFSQDFEYTHSGCTSTL